MSDSILLSVLTGLFSTYSYGDLLISGSQAFYRDGNGLAVADISDPLAIQSLGWVSLDGYGQAGMLLRGNYLYIIQEDSGLRVVDISQPQQPVARGGFATSGYSAGLSAWGSYVLIGTTPSNGLISIVDVSNPDSLLLVSSFTVDGGPYAIQTKGNLALISYRNFEGLDIYDLSNIQNPTHLKRVYLGNFSNIYIGTIASLEFIGDLVYLAGSSGFLVLNIADPVNPVSVGSLDLPSVWQRKLQIVGTKAYVAGSAVGNQQGSDIQVIDISDPTQLRLVEAYEAPGTTYGLAHSSNHLFVGGTSGIVVSSSALQVPLANRPPTAADIQISLYEDAELIINSLMFPLFRDVDGDTLAALMITSLPAAGRLDCLVGDSWQPVAVNQVFSVSDLDAGRLRFLPAANAHGSPYSTLSYRAGDGQAFSELAYSLRLDVIPLNDLPTATDDSLIIAVDSPTALSASDFGSFFDPDGDSLAVVQFITVPPAGTLEYLNEGNWLPVSPDQQFTAAQLAAGMLRYSPAANATRIPSTPIQFRVGDGTGFSSSHTLSLVPAQQLLIGSDQADSLVGGLGNDTLEGLAGDDTLFGGAGRDNLDGGPGSDLMDGGFGADQYSVDALTDQILDQGGIDTINTKITLTLPDFIEHLWLKDGASDGSGNGLDNRIFGNALANLLSGQGGDDDLRGANGSDTLIGGNGHDSLQGQRGPDLLRGQLGNDILSGGPGADRFRFDTIISAEPNSDVISDFNRAEGDRIELDATVFTGLSAGLLPASAFIAAAAFSDSQQRIRQTGALLFHDPDGNGPAASRVFASVSGAISLRDSDFWVV